MSSSVIAAFILGVGAGTWITIGAFLLGRVIGHRCRK